MKSAEAQQVKAIEKARGNEVCMRKGEIRTLRAKLERLEGLRKDEARQLNEYKPFRHHPHGNDPCPSIN